MPRNRFLKFGVIIFCLLSNVNSFAQISAEERIDVLKNVLPPSPNSASLGKYGEWPVSLYTGVPSINIPIYELKGRSISVPVSLSYHGSGNRVGEVASWVGLGWSLNAGGAIIRSIRGLPDDNGGYFENANQFSNPDDFGSSVPTDIFSLLLVNSAKNNSDTQEDIYTFNALGKSYRFIIHANGTIQTIPFSGIKFTTNPLTDPNTSANTWTVILEDGTKLLFGGTNFTETTEDSNYPVGDGRGISYISSWMLQSVTSPTGEVISFSYSPGGSIKQDSYYSQSDLIEYRTSTSSNCSPVNQSVNTKKNIERQTVFAKNLSSIESDLGRVEFILNPSERQDLQAGNALQEIKVFSKTSNTYIEDYVLTTSYSQAVSSNQLTDGISDGSYLNYRLRLTTLERKDMSNTLTTGQKWTFEYNPQNLPARRSFAQDHWGFFNGAITNATLLPKEYFVLPSSIAAMTGLSATGYGFMPSYHLIGADREGNADFIQAEMLTAINYPTGGKTVFTYEPNAVPVTEEKFSTLQVSLALNMSSIQNPQTNESSTTFTVTKPQYINISATSSRSSFDIVNARTSVSVIDQSGNTVVGFTNTAEEWSENEWFNLLTSGTYTFKVSSNVDPTELQGATDHISINATLKYEKSDGMQTYDKLVGGVRISNIKEYDGTSNTPVNQRSFIYESPLVLNDVDLVNDYITQQEKQTHDANTGENCYFTTVTRNSSSKFSLGNIQGGTVAYGKVTTLYGPNGENGATVSLFNNEEDAGVILSKTFPYSAPDSRDHRRGLLLEEKQLKPDMVTVLRKTTNTYSFAAVGRVTGFKAGYSINMDPYFCQNAYGNCGITRVDCPVTTEQVKHTSTTEITYDINGQNPVTVTTNYFYDNPNNLQPVRIESTDSKGNTLKTYNRTALEKTDIDALTPLTPSASAAIDAMVSRNMISAVIQQEKQRAGNLTNLSLTNYKVLDAVNIVPENVQVKISSNPLDTRILFNQYNSNGSLTEQQKANDVKEVYLWGYKSTYPVAKVIGSDYETVSALVRQAVLDNPVSDQQMREELNNIRTGLSDTKALVTTYTYAPLIGMTSQTDPNGRTIYYEYDGMNRVKLIRDQDNNVIKTYDYKYQQNTN